MHLPLLVSLIATQCIARTISIDLRIVEMGIPGFYDADSN